MAREAQRKTPLSPIPKTDCEPHNCVSKVLSLPNISTGYELQNVVNIVRVMADITHIDQNLSARTISLEGTSEQIAIAEKLLSVSETLRSSGTKPSSVLVYEAKPTQPDVSEKTPSNSSVETSSLVKVLYLPDFATTVELQDAVNIFRTIADITRIVPDPYLHSIWLRGTAEQLAIAERLVSVMEGLQSGKNRSSALVYEFKGSMPEPVVSEKLSEETILRMRKNICELTTCLIKALYLPDLSAVQLADAINRVRTTAQVSRTCPSPSRHVLMIRGTSEQVALAEKVANE
jgi:hypothetical protein